MVASRWILGLVGSAIILSGSSIATTQELPPTPILLAQTEQKTEAHVLFVEGMAAFQQGTAESYQQAIEKWEEALVLYEQQNNQAQAAITSLVIGFVYTNSGFKQEALTSFNQALLLYQAIEDRSGEATALNNIGTVYSDLGEKQQALNYYQQALPLLRAVGDRSVEATTLNNIGTVYSALGEKQQALDYYQQAFPIFRAVGDRRGEATALNNIGGIYDALGEKQQALDYYQQAFPIFRAVGDRSSEAVTLSNIGAVYNDLGEKQQALDYYQQAFPIFRAVGDRSGEASTLNNIGAVYDDLGEKQQALDFYQQALPLLRAVSDRRGEAISLNNIGRVYDDLGEKQQALDFFNQAFPIFRAVGDRSSEATTLGNIGTVYDALGEKQQALDYFQQSLALFRAVGDSSGAATTLGNIGTVYDDLGKKQQALDYYQQALPLLRAVGDRRGEAVTLSNIGAVYWALGEQQQALDYFQQALPLSRAVGARSSEANTLNNIGGFYFKLGEQQQALDYFQQALPLSQAVGDRSGEAVTLENIGYQFQEQNQPQLAITFYKEAVNTYEALRKNIKGFSTKEQQTFTNTVEGVYRRLADLLIQQDRLLEAQRVLDLLKIQELDDFLENVRGNQNSQQGIYLLPPEQQIISGYDAILEKAVTVSAELTDIKQTEVDKRTPAQVQAIASRETDYQAIVEQLLPYLQSSQTEQTLTQLTPATIQAIELEEIKPLHQDLNSLTQNAGLLYTAIFDDQLELILTTADNLPIRKTVEIDNTQLNQTILDFRTALTSPGSNALAPAQALYNLIIKPLETELAAANIDTLLYAPDAQLRYIPLAALHDGNQWLTEKYQINHLSALALTDLQEKSQPNVNVLAGAFANGVYQFDIAETNYRFAGLKGAEAEVKGIADTFPSATFIDNDFNTTNTVPKMGDYSIVHLATHAAFVPGRPEESFILFGDGSRTNLREVEKSWALDNVDLVVLSACETGINGQFGKGQEILGFGYLMQLAGARASLSSLWEVSDAGTQILMTEFYDQLKANPQISKLDALQAAQLALITNNEQVIEKAKRGWGNSSELQNTVVTNYDHPYYWSPFILIGNGL